MKLFEMPTVEVMNLEIENVIATSIVCTEDGVSSCAIETDRM